MTDPPTEYSAHDEGVIEAALDRAWQEYESEYGDDSGGFGEGDGGNMTGDEPEEGGGGGGPSGITVTARIEWAGDTARANGGSRTTRLDRLQLGRVREALSETRDATRRATQARPAESYRAQGWHAQLRELTESARGSAAADRAGLSPTARTLTAWLSEDRTPTRANRDRIEEAYNSLRTTRVDNARQTARDARHNLSQALSDALGERYGSEIRLRDISNLRLED